jgi:nanoRNase/pAp phosphatase (c-di-AMP/oligoRNAs hydrolase)
MKAAEKTSSRLQKLIELFTGKAYLLVVMQDNPDPDSVAAAVAVRRLARSQPNLQCSIANGGTVGRGENRALVKYLGLNLRSCEEVDYGKYDLIATVDTQPGAGNNSLPEAVLPDIVIDHHPIRRQTRMVPFTDIRSGYGATSTIMVEYLIEAGDYAGHALGHGSALRHPLGHPGPRPRSLAGRHRSHPVPLSLCQ